MQTARRSSRSFHRGGARARIDVPWSRDRRRMPAAVAMENCDEPPSSTLRNADCGRIRRAVWCSLAGQTMPLRGGGRRLVAAGGRHVTQQAALEAVACRRGRRHSVSRSRQPARRHRASGDRAAKRQPAASDRVCPASRTPRPVGRATARATRATVRTIATRTGRTARTTGNDAREDRQDYYDDWDGHGGYYYDDDQVRRRLG